MAVFPLPCPPPWIIKMCFFTDTHSCQTRLKLCDIEGEKPGELCIQCLKLADNSAILLDRPNPWT